MLRPSSTSEDRFAFAALAAILSACVYPTDKGNELRIEVTPIARLIRGDSVRIDARLLEPNNAPIPDARFVYASANKSVAVVRADGLVIAVDAGTTTIIVQALGTERTSPAQVPIAVSATVSIDSLRPLNAKWGQILSLYGTGLGPTSADGEATIDGVSLSLMSYVPKDSAHPERVGVLGVLAAPPLLPAVADSVVGVVVTTPRGAGALSTPLTVEPVDIFEPNTLAPSDLGTITGLRAFPGLALEAATLTPRDLDWYRFTTTTTGDWTIELRTPSVVGTTNISGSPTPTFFPAGGVEAESLPSPPGNYYRTFVAYYPGRGSSAGGLIFCRGRGGWKTYPADTTYGIPADTNPETVQSAYPATLSLRNIPPGQHDFMVIWAGGWMFGVDANYRYYPGRRPDQWSGIYEGGSVTTTPVRYDLVIRPGVPTGSVHADPYEPNDFCEDARPILTVGAAAFSDSVFDLTFDHPGDQDWYTVDVQQAGLLQARYTLDSTLYGELLTTDPDSAVIVGDFGRGWTCGVNNPWLTSFGPDGCRMEGASLQPGLYYLYVNRWPPGTAPYQLIFSWAPGAVAVAPQRLGGP